MNPISNILNQLSDWRQNDPNALKKSLFIAGASLLLIFVFSGIYLLNFSAPNLDTSNNSTIIDKNKVTPKNFQSSNRFDRIGTNSVLANKKMVVSDNKLFGFDKDSKLSIDTQTVSGSPQFIPYSIYVSGDSVIINESKDTTVYNSKAKTFNKLSKVSALTPVGNNKFWYLKKENNNLIVASTANLVNPEEGSEGLGGILPFVDVAVINIAVFENNSYILISNSLGLDGIMEIWKFEGGTFKQTQVLTGLYTVSVLKSGILYTDRLNSEFTWVNFKDQIDGKKQSINIKNQLSSEKVQGDLLASRCNELNRELYCLVKEGVFSYYDYTQTDAIVKINLSDSKDSKISLPFGRIQFSADNLFFDNNKKLIVIGQEDNNVYKLK